MTNLANTILEVAAGFDKIATIDPHGAVYGKLCDLLDRADDDTLRVIHAARVKFVSALAFNRMLRRGLIQVPPMG